MSFSVPGLSRDKVIMVLFAVGVIAFSGVVTKLFEHKPQAPILQVGNSVLTLKGAGMLPPLHEVMQRDQVLQGMVDKLRAVPATQIFLQRDAVDALVVNALFRWAGADTIADQAYGPFIDPHVVAFMKKTGVLPETMPAGTPIDRVQADAFTKTWLGMFEHYRVALLIQMAGKDVYDGGASYDSVRDRVAVTGQVSRGFIQQFQQDLLASKESGAAMRALLDFVDATKGFSHLSNQEQDLIMSITAPPSVDQTQAAAAPGAAAGKPYDVNAPIGGGVAITQGSPAAQGMTNAAAPSAAKTQTPPKGAAQRQ